MKGATSFGETLREHRLARLMTQAELAERAGLSERAISDLERGLKLPQPATVHMLVNALALPVDRAEAFGRLARVRTRPSEVTAAELHNLPTPLTSLVGRDEAIASLAQLLSPLASHSPQARLVTLTGAGGCGKTRLAIEVARRATREFSDGVWFTDLSSIADPALVPSIVLTTTGGHELSNQSPVESVLRHLRGRKLLLVLDNCEHLIDACADLLVKLLGASPDLHVVATSREALRLPGEVVWRVPSLTVPDLVACVDPDVLLESAAARLFVDRMRPLEPGFSLTASNAPAVADICRRLDGIPLAIELAAACASAMSVQEIAARLDDRFGLLTGGHRTALMRHKTLRATIDWSHDLLSPAEQTLLRRLAVFAGGWTLDAAEQVCAADPLDQSQILQLLKRLIDQSLVASDVDAGRTRYRFLQTVRAYAIERLEATGEASEVQARHRQWCLAFVERAAADSKRPEHANWIPLLAAEQDNIRAALESCALESTAAEVQLRLAAGMGQFWFPMHPAEARRWLAAALARADTTPSAARAAALSWLAQFELLYGDPSSGRDLARAALSDARALGDARVAAEALLALALATNEDETAARVALLEEGLPLARSADDPALLARYLGAMAATAAEAGDRHRAQMLVEEGSAVGLAADQPLSLVTITAQLGWLAVAEDRLDEAELHFQTLLDLGARLGSGHYRPAVLGLGQVSLRRGDTQQARALYRRLLVGDRETSPSSAMMATTLVYLASVDAADGLHARAQRLLGASEAWFAARGPSARRWWPNDPVRRGLVPVPPPPVDPLLIQAREEGRRMSLDAAVAHALE